MATQATGNVIVAPNVLINLVALGLREVPGIARSGSVPRAHGQHRVCQRGEVMGGVRGVKHYIPMGGQ